MSQLRIAEVNSLTALEQGDVAAIGAVALNICLHHFLQLLLATSNQRTTVTYWHKHKIIKELLSWVCSVEVHPNNSGHYISIKEFQSKKLLFKRKQYHLLRL